MLIWSFFIHVFWGWLFINILCRLFKIWFNSNLKLKVRTLVHTLSELFKLKASSSFQFPINVMTASLPSQSNLIFELSYPSITWTSLFDVTFYLMLVLGKIVLFFFQSLLHILSKFYPFFGMRAMSNLLRLTPQVVFLQ